MLLSAEMSYIKKLPYGLEIILRNCSLFTDFILFSAVGVTSICVFRETVLVLV